MAGMVAGMELDHQAEQRPAAGHEAQPGFDRPVPEGHSDGLFRSKGLSKGFHAKRERIPCKSEDADGAGTSLTLLSASCCY